MTTDTTTAPGPKSVRDFFRSWKFWRPFLGIAAGGIGGYLYYYFIGCNSGTCPITSSPYGSIIMGVSLVTCCLAPHGEKAIRKKRNNL